MGSDWQLGIWLDSLGHLTHHGRRGLAFYCHILNKLKACRAALLYLFLLYTFFYFTPLTYGVK